MKESLRQEYQEKMRKLRQEFKNELIKERQKEIEKEVDQELDQIDQVLKFENADISASDTKVAAPKKRAKKRAKKIKKVKRLVNGGQTKAEEFIPSVIDILKGKENNECSRKEIADEILLQGLNNLADIHRHDDGQLRFYKTLGRTRKLMIEQGILVENKNRIGLWKMKNHTLF